ncbi:MAG: divalent cation tolerance protein CutA [Bacteroidia bacterium]|nr:divalent cation tolerance protein CutA [Bacteroidia bacterium]
MVNIYIYTDSNNSARQIVLNLMKKKLIAHASIDKDNESFILKNGEIVEEENYVITGQTKALLFNQIVDEVAQNDTKNLKIFSVPITQCNKVFEDILRLNTKAVTV